MRGLLLLGAIALLGLFAGLSAVDFTDVREARDALVAREIKARHEPLIPLMAGEPLLDKPLLGYLPEIMGASLTPGSPVGPRAIEALAALVLVALTGWLGARHLTPRAGWCAAAVLATTLALPLASRADGVQVFASVFGWIACLILADALLRRASAPQSATEKVTSRRLAIAYVAMATAIVMAGPLAGLWPLAGLAPVLWTRRAERPWRRLHPIPGLLMVLGLSLPWYAAMTDRFGLSFLVRSIAFPYGEGPAGPWYAAPARALGFVLIAFFPWTTLLPAALLRATRQEPRAAGAGVQPPLRAEALLAGWLAAAALPILFAPAAPLSAALPALPAAALLVGALLERAFERDPLWSGAAAQAAALLAFTGTIASVLLVAVSARLPEAAPALRLVAAFLILVSWAPSLAAFLGRRGAAIALLAAPVALGWPLLAWRTLPALEDYLSARPVAEALNATAPPGTPLLLLEPPPPSLRLYTGRHLVHTRNLTRDMNVFRGEDGFAYVAFPGRRASEIARAASPEPIEILLSMPTLSLARVGGP